MTPLRPRMPLPRVLTQARVAQVLQTAAGQDRAAGSRTGSLLPACPPVFPAVQVLFPVLPIQAHWRLVPAESSRQPLPGQQAVQEALSASAQWFSVCGPQTALVVL